MITDRYGINIESIKSSVVASALGYGINEKYTDRSLYNVTGRDILFSARGILAVLY